MFTLARRNRGCGGSIQAGHEGPVDLQQMGMQGKALQAGVTAQAKAWRCASPGDADGQDGVEKSRAAWRGNGSCSGAHL